jgi:hypothetical protein
MLAAIARLGAACTPGTTTKAPAARRAASGRPYRPCVSRSHDQFADDIWFTMTDGPSIDAHPLCPNTWRNGKKIGDEAPAAGY